MVQTPTHPLSRVSRGRFREGRFWRCQVWADIFVECPSQNRPLENRPQ